MADGGPHTERRCRKQDPLGEAALIIRIQIRHLWTNNDGKSDRGIGQVPGVRAVGYVHDLSRTLACCDLAVVQGGLSTTMELVANRRPFIYLPLRNHFEQNFHVAHRLRRYGAPPPTDYDEATPEQLARQMAERLRAQVEYAPVEAGGAARAAALIAPLLQRD